MARLKRYCPSGIPQHVIQRGNNRSACFSRENDFAAYAHWLDEAARKHRLAIHGWVFMTNHVHLLVTPERDDSVSKSMQTLGRRYVRYFNHTYGRTGTLFEGRFKSCIVEESTYFLTCLRYIELNPVRAGMVRDPSEYTWSSYRANAFGIQGRIWRPHAQYLALGETDKEILQQAALMHDIGKIGCHANLNKKDQLTAKEYEIFKEHPTHGKNILEPLTFLHPVIPGVHLHHERWDGKGYPVGLSGADIPLMARILAVADSYDAMTSNRAYRKALAHKVAMEELKRCSGTQFDPAIMDAFRMAIENHRREAVRRKDSIPP